jgi:hypothetical protein
MEESEALSVSNSGSTGRQLPQESSSSQRELTSTDEEPPVKKKRKLSEIRGSSGVRFNASWNLPPHIESSTKGGKFAHCRLCNSHFGISHGGFNDVTRHVNGSGHVQRVKEIQNVSTIATAVASAQSHSNADMSKSVVSAEIMMCQFIAMHNRPFQTADHLSDLFKSMCPDSKVASALSCKHNKTKAIICDAIDPHLKKPVLDVVRSSPFNLLCDESNERGDSVKLLTVLVRLFESDNANISTRHLNTIGITDLTANGIFSGLEEVLQKYDLSFDNMVSFTSDTCNVMKGTRGGVIAKLSAKQPKVFDIHCICHVVSLCLKAAVKAIPMKVDDLLVDIYYHFHHSVKRVASLVEYTEFCSTEFKSVLKHRETRWLSLGQAIQRTLHLWEPLCSYFHSHPHVEKAGKVRTISRLLSDPMSKLWLLFLANVLPVFDKFNKFFQTSSTSTIHKVLGECERLLKTVLSFFIDSKTIKENLTDLTKLDYCDSSKQLSNEEIFVGDDTTALTTHLEDNEGESIQRIFFPYVVEFFEKFLKKLIKVFDFKSQRLHALGLLDPAKSVTMPGSVFDLIEDNFSIDFDKSLTKLEYREFVCDDEVSFLVNVHSLKSPMGSPKYENLSLLALNLLAISTSNANSERVFSLVRRIKTDFRASLSPETVSALIGCHFNKTSQCCELSKFDEELIIQAKHCTHQRNLSYGSK